MKWTSLVVLPLTCAIGCGTFLAVRELEVKDATCADGVVINKGRPYDVKIEVVDPTLTTVMGAKGVSGKRFVGVDHGSVVNMDVSRMPFASAELGVTLNDLQLPKEVSLTSDTGAVRAAEAAKSSLEKAREVKAELATTSTTTAAAASTSTTQP